MSLMKRILSLACIALVCASSLTACTKKANPAPEFPFGDSITLFIMDTTQALLPEAKLQIGKKSFTSSYDGRIVVSAQDLLSVKSAPISCEGYDSKSIEPQDLSSAMIDVVMTPQKRPKEHGASYAYGSLRGRKEKGEMVYMASMASMDGAIEAEVVVDEMEMPAMYDGAAMNNAISAGQLTAGEVNDFTKWSLWAQILDSTHRRFIKDWSIEPRERYTVQVTDKYGYPIANYPVSLKDVNGNTVYQALTDNTGKAELWNGLTGKRAQVQQPAWQSIVIDEPCDLSSDVDVLFVFDATGSMGDELRYLQAEMKDVISRAAQATGGLAIRTGAVVYRDHGDEYLTRISRLTDDIATTQNFIDKQEAGGGGDYPEAVPEALMAALNSAGWNENARARIAFLILDAPCHQDSATIALLHDQILNAAAQGVRLVPVVCSGIDESAEYLLRAMALATNGTSFFLTDDSGIGNTHLKPTTDSLKVEHLNDMLVRTIVEFSYMPDCTGHWHEEEIANVHEEFIPSPFDAQELKSDPSIPHGPTTLYLLDVSGKLITIYQGVLEEAGDRQLASLGIPLSTGIYFIKAFYDGKWHTKKILVH